MQSGTPNDVKPLAILAINAGTSDPSSTRLLAGRAGAATLEYLETLGKPATLSAVDLAPIGAQITASLLGTAPLPEAAAVMEQMAAADALIMSTPVYKAGVSGLFKAFVDTLENDLIIAKPMILAATAGTSRHAMVVDEQMRPLFAFMRAFPVPTSLFATAEDWADPSFGTRVKRAGVELAELAASGIERRITGASRGSYNSEFGSTAQAQGNPELSFDTEMMRLAAGGSV